MIAVNMTAYPSVRKPALDTPEPIELEFAMHTLMCDIHNTGNNPHRMPAILRKEDCDAWLGGTMDEARAALRQYPADLMTAYPVSTRVNTPKNNDEKLIERDESRPHIDLA
jgi:hypothetical protein